MKQITITNSVTDRNFITEKYFHEVSSIPMITPEKEVELAFKIKKGDKRAENELVKANLRFVISCAKLYQNRGLTFEDLIAEGNIGLIKAAQRFDETRGFKFISYAVGWIRQSMLEAIYKHSQTVRIPSNKILQQGKLRDLLSKKQQEGNGYYSVDDICNELKIDQETFAILVQNKNSSSLDSKINSDSENTLMDILSNEVCEFDKMFNDLSLKKQITMAFQCLTEVEKHVINNYFGINKQNRELTLSELSGDLLLSTERIRQIKDKALKKLKMYFSRNFKDVKL